VDAIADTPHSVLECVAQADESQRTKRKPQNQIKMNEIRINSTWVALKDFSIGIGSHSRNPNTTSLWIPKGTLLKWDDDSPSGNVWFRVEIEGVKHRGKIESGRITNVIKDGKIELKNNGKDFVIYSGEFLKKLLNH